MQQIEIREWTDPAALVVSEGRPPTCGPGQVRIRVKATAITHSLSLLIQGKYQRKPAFPFVPGTFVAGIVVEAGAGVDDFRMGQPVIAAMEYGGLADEALAWRTCTYAIPEGLPFDVANSFNTTYSSALAALTWPRLLDLKANEKLLVTGASGLAGGAAIELARVLGADVIGAATTEEKCGWAREKGAQHTVLADPATLRDAVMGATGGAGVDAVFEPVGGAVFEQALRCLAPDGRIVPFGFAGGTIPQIAANLALVKNISIGGLNMSHYKLIDRERHEDRIRALFVRLGDWWQQGLLRPFVAARFPIGQVREAFAALGARERPGHVSVVFED